ncbi:MAG TPA: UDP-N-acetylmuramate dehydrogenase [Chitinophagaceae bacterium]|nr:UDP-N-acetylmuramate dehydrogenase [Chitinophagaceae bacterium]
MTLREHISLKNYNTFGIGATARYFAAFDSVETLQALLAEDKVRSAGRLLFLGGGSNILLTGDVDGAVLRNEILGISVTGEDEEYVYLRSGAGENWHRLVLHSLEQDYAGLENLSLIPGSVGASPMQNIGAYGVEIKDVFHELEAWHIGDRALRVFSAEECRFGYRESIFKGALKGQYVITAVTFRLRKQPVFHTEYGAIRQELESMGVTELSIQAISRAVINIRTSKLPDPAVIGNAGSFFKNPSVPAEQFEALKEMHPGIVGFPNPDGTVKLAAGWLIEQCGWKGVRRGDAGCHAKQALVLVNYGGATGKQIYDLSTEIMESVRVKFGVALEREVNLV